MPVADIDPDMLPPSGKTVREVLGTKHKDEGKEPPKTRRTQTSRPPTAKQQEATLDTMQEDLQTAYEFLASVLIYVSPNGAQAMEDNAQRCAEQWVAQARKSPRVYRFLTTITEGSGWLGIALAHAPIALGITHDMRTAQAGMPPESMQEAFEQFMAAGGEAGMNQDGPTMENIG